jgi:hypothetical protein
VAYLASNYLANLLQTVGPVKARFNEAFQFNPNYQPPLGGRSSPGDDPYTHDDEHHVVDNVNAPILGKLGGQQLLWNGNDFWSVVGWAFNCAVLYPERWRWWRPWLDFMLLVLWEDWEKRMMADVAANTARPAGESHVFPMMNTSLLASYVSLHNSRRGHGLRYIVQAVFADGHTAAQTKFTEVFPNEMQQPANWRNKRKREAKLDLENMQYGDYVDSDDELEANAGPVDSAASTPVKAGKGMASHTQETTKFEHYALNADALHDTVSFRQRLIELLTQVSTALPHQFATQDELYAELAETMRHLPLSMFEALVMPDRNPIYGTLGYVCVERGDLSFLLRELLHWFLPASYLKPGEVDAQVDAAELLTWELLQRCYLPHAASSASVEENAKLGVLLEKAVLLLFEEPDKKIRDRTGLQEAIAKGVEARERRAKVRRGRNGRVEPQEEAAKERLERSGRMLRMILSHLETRDQVLVASV